MSGGVGTALKAYCGGVTVIKRVRRKNGMCKNSGLSTQGPEICRAH